MPPSQPPISDRLLAAITRYFPTHAPADIMQVLNLYGVESYELEHERVKLAILKLSEGDPDKLQYYLDSAKRDYRDVLYWAEYYPPTAASTLNS